MKFGKEMAEDVFSVVQDMTSNGIMTYLSVVVGVTPQKIFGFFVEIVTEKNQGKSNNNFTMQHAIMACNQLAILPGMPGHAAGLKVLSC
jgi:hypothetical protein